MPRLGRIGRRLYISAGRLIDIELSRALAARHDDICLHFTHTEND